VFDSLGENSKMLTQEEGDFFIKGIEAMGSSHIAFDGIFWREPVLRGDKERLN